VEDLRLKRAKVALVGLDKASVFSDTSEITVLRRDQMRLWTKGEYLLIPERKHKRLRVGEERTYDRRKQTRQSNPVLGGDYHTFHKKKLGKGAKGDSINSRSPATDAGQQNCDLSKKQEYQGLQAAPTYRKL